MGRLRQQTKPLLSIGHAADELGVSIQTLRRWERSGTLLPSFISPGKHRYYDLSALRFFKIGMLDEAFVWVGAQTGTLPDPTFYCESKEAFRTRSLLIEAELGRAGVSPDKASLLTASLSEIGNNCFDHNIGQWRDVRGVFIGFDTRRKTIVVADRGRGIRESLLAVRPGIATDAEALRIAFTEVLSGRSPEPRGNGLKFVRDIVAMGAANLYFATGDAELTLEGANDVAPQHSERTVFGSIAVITYSV